MQLDIKPGTTISGLEAPRGWHIVGRWGNGLVWERLSGQALKVIEDISVQLDGKRWLHVSFSTPSKKMPTYEDVQAVRKSFIGEDRESYMVFPTQDRYVNIHSACLHLYCCMDDPRGVLPHFEGVVNGVTTI
jgi:hypothetical protein